MHDHKSFWNSEYLVYSQMLRTYRFRNIFNNTTKLFLIEGILGGVLKMFGNIGTSLRMFSGL